MRAAFLWLLILHTLHLPIPFPDLDGECRGTPIQSLSEAQAWHFVLLGVLSSDDVDRGPFRSDNQGPGDSAPDSPYGDSAIVAVPVTGSADGPPGQLAPLMRAGDCCLAVNPCDSHGNFSALEAASSAGIARAARVCFCVWQL